MTSAASFRAMSGDAASEFISSKHCLEMLRVSSFKIVFGQTLKSKLETGLKFLLNPPPLFFLKFYLFSGSHRWRVCHQTTCYQVRMQLCAEPDDEDPDTGHPGGYEKRLFNKRSGRVAPEPGKYQFTYTNSFMTQGARQTAEKAL